MPSWSAKGDVAVFDCAACRTIIDGRPRRYPGRRESRGGQLFPFSRADVLATPMATIFALSGSFYENAQPLLTLVRSVLNRSAGCPLRGITPEFLLAVLLTHAYVPARSGLPTMSPSIFDRRAVSSPVEGRIGNGDGGRRRAD